MNKWIEILKDLWERREVKYAVGGIVLVILLIAIFSGGDPSKIVADDVYRCRVQRGDLVVSILQSGELEAKKSRDFINDASRDAKIVAIVDDGAYVTNGQLLVELESAELADRYLRQKSAAATAEADLMHSQEAAEIARLKHSTDIDSATLRVELAELALKKYIEAEYPQMVLKAQSDITLAEQELKTARGELEGTQELFEKDFSSRLELESAQLNVDRKEIEVRNKTEDLSILQEYTYVRTLKELENSLENARSELERLEKSYAAEQSQTAARIEAQKTRLEIENNQLANRERELKNTKIYADFDGQVFYVSERRRPEIEQGAALNFRQKILSYPDLSSWNVKVGVPEAMIDKIALDQEGVATLDAVPGLILRGRVSKISAVPDSQGWFNTGVKTYTVMIDITSKTDAQLKPGMSATVEIVTDQLRGILYVPIQSVVSDKEKHFVYVIKRKRKELREVEIGKYNTQFIEIISGLNEGDELMLYAEVEPDIDSQLKKSPLDQENKEGSSQEKE
jgi:RND family efflux transporter MFP subunit